MCYVSTLSIVYLIRLFQKEIKIYNINGSFRSVAATLQLSSEQLCSQLNKNIHDEDNIKNGFCWTIVEVWKDEGIGN